LFLPVLILGGIFGRVFTVTEASAVAALYAIIIGFFVYRDIKIRDLPEIFMETAITTGLVLILAGASTVTAWIIANEQVISRPVDHLQHKHDGHGYPIFVQELRNCLDGAGWSRRRNVEGYL
jgi:TRAP-type C4-dicarboxylate transport system permease large subunit